MILAGLQKLSVNDYPGRNGCVVFTKGCNYQCPWCNVPEFVSFEPKGKDRGISLKDFFDFLKQKKGVLTACTISGGEPLCHADLPDFCGKIKKLGYKVKLDTNGSNPWMLSDLLKKNLLDYVAMDIKAPKAKYGQAIGYPNDSIHYLFDKLQKSIVLLKQSGLAYEFKTTAAPFLYRNDILEIAHWLRPAKKYVLQVFKSEKTLNPAFSDLGAYSPKYLFGLQQALAPFFDVCEVKMI